MHSRIFIGVTAWVLGAVTATTGSVLVVSLLGQGITGSSGQMLTQDMVNKELASEATETSPPVATPTVTASVKPSPTRATASPSPVTPSPPVTTASSPSAFTSPTPTPVTTSATPPPPSTGTVLTSQGGEVVAACEAAGAYLLSWSPRQGYEVGDVWRGPAATARVSFESTTVQLTMVVQCSAGVPSATSTRDN